MYLIWYNFARGIYMYKKSDNSIKQFSFWLDTDLKKKFCMRYKGSISKFFRNCIRLALQDEKFFTDVFFMDNKADNETSPLEVQKSIF